MKEGRCEGRRKHSVMARMEVRKRMRMVVVLIMVREESKRVESEM